MANIKVTPLSGGFNNTLFQFLKTFGIEGFRSYVYADSKVIPTLGADML